MHSKRHTSGHAGKAGSGKQDHSLKGSQVVPVLNTGAVPGHVHVCSLAIAAANLVSGACAREVGPTICSMHVGWAGRLRQRHWQRMLLASMGQGRRTMQWQAMAVSAFSLSWAIE